MFTTCDLEVTYKGLEYEAQLRDSLVEFLSRDMSRNSISGFFFFWIMAVLMRCYTSLSVRHVEEQWCCYPRTRA